MAPTKQSAFRPDLFRGKTVLISGGGTGIGLGMSRSFAAHGASVFIMGRREDVLRKAVQELGESRAAYAPGDVRDADACKRAVDACVRRFGSLDVLVCNAAGNFATAAEDLSANALKTVMEIDFHGTFNLAKAALEPLKRAAGGGVIIAISATLHYKVTPFQMHASAAKAAIDVMTRSLGVEWGAEHGIRCVGIAPGPIEGTVGGPTGRVFGGLGAPTDADAVKYVVPIGRYGRVEDVANAALFVASDAGSFVNATVVVVDGGHWHEAAHTFLGARDVIRDISVRERQTTKAGVAKL